MEKRSRRNGEGVPIGAELDRLRADNARLERELVEARSLASRSRQGAGRNSSAEDAQRAAEEQYRLLFAANPIPMFIFDEETLRFLAVNAAAVRHYGWSEEEFLGLTILDIRPPEDRDLARRVVERSRGARETEIGVLRHSRKDGTTREMEVTATSISFEGRPARLCAMNDVTERREAEEALRASEARFRSVADNLSEGLMLFDPEGNLTYQNPASLQIHGFGPDEEGRIAHGDLAPTWRAWDETGRPITSEEWPVSRVLRHERFQNQVLRVLRPETGYEFYGSYNGCPIYDAAGKLVLGFITIHDITDRVRAEEEISKREQRLRAVFESDMVGMIFWNTDGEITDANSKFLEMVGYTREDLVSGVVSWAEMTPPEYQAADEYALDELRTTGVDTPYEKEYIRKGGTRIPIIIGASMLDERRYEGVAFVLDITERKQAEQRVRALQEVTAALAGALTPDQVSDVVLRDGVRAMGANQGFITLRVDGADELETRSTIGVGDAPTATWKRHPLRGHTPSAEAVRTGRTILLRSLSEHQAAYPESLPDLRTHGLESTALTPLSVGGRILGAITFGFSGPRDFTEDDVAFLRAIAGQAAQALERARLHEETQRRAAELNEANDRLQAQSEELAGNNEELQAQSEELSGNNEELQAQAAELERTVGHLQEVQEALRASEKRFRGQAAELDAVIESIADGVSVYDAQGNTLRMNAAGRRILGITEEDAALPLARRSRRLSYFTPDGTPLALRDLTAMRAVRGETSRGERVLAVRPDGSRLWLSVSAAPILDADGRVDGAVAVYSDVTGYVRQEDALKEADRRKNEYISMLSHELRNPLAAIANGVAWALAVGKDPALRRAMEIANRQVANMARMLDGLLDITRISRGRISLRQERLDLSSVVRSGIETVAAKIEARHHRLSLSLPPEPLPVDGDPVRLSQVVANLLDNAARYTPEGGEIVVTAAQEGDEVVVRVRDSGIGIAPDFLPHVFEVFERGEHATGSAEGGIGLGLALVCRLVELHGGRVDAHSEGLGKGSEFIVRLPLPADVRGRNSASVPSGPGHQPPSRKRILLVEDNTDMAELLAMTLELEGHQVAVAHDGPAALEAASRARPDVVLLDLGLPTMDGYEVARRLRQMQGFADVPLVAVTGYGQEEDRRRTAQAGFAGHLLKPVSPEALLRALDAIPRLDDASSPQT